MVRAAAAAMLRVTKKIGVVARARHPKTKRRKRQERAE
jgi:hypothetical protein